MASAKLQVGKISEVIQSLKNTDAIPGSIKQKAATLERATSKLNGLVAAQRTKATPIAGPSGKNYRRNIGLIVRMLKEQLSDRNMTPEQSRRIAMAIATLTRGQTKSVRVKSVSTSSIAKVSSALAEADSQLTGLTVSGNDEDAIEQKALLSQAKSGVKEARRRLSDILAIEREKRVNSIVKQR